MKGKCPHCNKDLTGKQYARHTIWTPIVCSKCSRRYHFDRREWFFISIPLLIAMFANILNNLWGKLVFSSQVHLLVSILCLVAMLIVGIQFLIKIRNIKLVEAKPKN